MSPDHADLAARTLRLLDEMIAEWGRRAYRNRLYAILPSDSDPDALLAWAREFIEHMWGDRRAWSDDEGRLYEC